MTKHATKRRASATRASGVTERRAPAATNDARRVGAAVGEEPAAAPPKNWAWRDDVATCERLLSELRREIGLSGDHVDDEAILDRRASRWKDDPFFSQPRRIAWLTCMVLALPPGTPARRRLPHFLDCLSKGSGGVAS